MLRPLLLVALLSGCWKGECLKPSPQAELARAEEICKNHKGPKTVRSYQITCFDGLQIDVHCVDWWP